MFNRRRMLLLVAGLGTIAVACSTLFEDAVQCTLDADCSAFPNTVCGPDRTCVPADSFDGGVRGGGTLPDGAPGSGDEDAALEGVDAATVRCLPAGTRPLTPIPGTAFTPTGGGEGTEIKANTRLACDKDWALTGTVVVRSGATLLVDKTVVLKASAGASLIIQPGARLLAVGSAEEPVVITSAKAEGERARGDFRGVFVLGKASAAGQLLGDPLLAYGAAPAVPADTSGSLKFLRVEYSQVGLQLAGVGTGTSLDSVEVRMTADDGFTFTGGTVNGKHLVTQLPGDEGFVFSGNYSGKLHYVLSQRIGAGAGKNAILVEGAGTRPTIFNATFCGTAEANLAMGVLVRNAGQPNLRNGIIMGYAAGMDQVGDAGNVNIAAYALFGQSVDNQAYDEDAGEENDASPYFDDDNGFDEKAFLNEPARANTTNNPNVGKCFDPAAPNFAPATAIAAPAPNNDGFFDTTGNFRGAVKDGNDGWTKAAWLVWKAN